MRTTRSTYVKEYSPRSLQSLPTSKSAPVLKGSAEVVTVLMIVAGQIMKERKTLVEGATCTTPAHTAGAVTVTVTGPDGQAGSLASAFTYT